MEYSGSKFIFVFDIYQSQKDIYKTKQEEALSLLSAVQKAGENVFISNREVEKLIYNRLFDNAYMISKLEDERKLFPDELNQISVINNIDHIYFFSGKK